LDKLLASGQLAQTDMVWKPGMAQWTPVSAFAQVATNDPPRRVYGDSDSPGVAHRIGKLSLPVAALIALPAGVLAVLGLELASLIVAGFAFLPGVIALFASLAAPRRGAIIVGALTAVFLAGAVILFCVGAQIARDRIETANQTIAKAGKIEEERLRAEAARKEAKEHLDKSAAALAEASKQTKKNAELLEQIAVQSKELDAKRKREEDGFAKREVALKTQESESKQRLEAAEKTERDAKAKLDVALGKEKEAKDLLGDAEAKEKKAVDALGAAEKKSLDLLTKEKDIGEHLRKVKEEYDNLKGLLRTRNLEERRKVIVALGRIGPPPATVDYVPRDLHREVVENAIKNPKIFRADALATLDKLEPAFAPLARTLVASPKLLGDYVNAIGELPNHADLGLPLIQAHLDMEFEWLAPEDKEEIAAGQQILHADIQALAKIVQQEKSEESRKLLVGVPESKLARRVFSSVYRKDVLRPLVNKVISGI